MTSSIEGHASSMMRVSSSSSSNKQAPLASTTTQTATTTTTTTTANCTMQGAFRSLGRLNKSYERQQGERMLLDEPVKAQLTGHSQATLSPLRVARHKSTSGARLTRTKRHTVKLNGSIPINCDFYPHSSLSHSNSSCHMTTQNTQQSSSNQEEFSSTSQSQVGRLRPPISNTQKGAPLSSRAVNPSLEPPPYQVLDHPHSQQLPIQHHHQATMQLATSTSLKFNNNNHQASMAFQSVNPTQNATANKTTFAPAATASLNLSSNLSHASSSHQASNSLGSRLTASQHPSWPNQQPQPSQQAPGSAIRSGTQAHHIGAQFAPAWMHQNQNPNQNPNGASTSLNLAPSSRECRQQQQSQSEACLISSSAAASSLSRNQNVICRHTTQPSTPICSSVSGSSGSSRPANREPSGSRVGGKNAKGCTDISVKWYIVVIALLGLICALIGTIVGAVHSAGRDYISLSLLLAGVGLVLIAITWIAVRVSMRTYRERASMMGQPGALHQHQHQQQHQQVPPFNRMIYSLGPHFAISPHQLGAHYSRLVYPNQQQPLASNNQQQTIQAHSQATGNHQLNDQRLYLMALASAAVAAVSSPQLVGTADDQAVSSNSPTQQQQLAQDQAAQVNPSSTRPGQITHRFMGLIRNFRSRIRTLLVPAQQQDPRMVQFCDTPSQLLASNPAALAALLRHHYNQLHQQQQRLAGIPAADIRPPPPSYQASVIQDQAARSLWRLSNPQGPFPAPPQPTSSRPLSSGTGSRLSNPIEPIREQPESTAINGQPVQDGVEQRQPPPPPRSVTLTNNDIYVPSVSNCNGISADLAGAIRSQPSTHSDLQQPQPQIASSMSVNQQQANEMANTRQPNVLPDNGLPTMADDLGGQSGRSSRNRHQNLNSNPNPNLNLNQNQNQNQSEEGPARSGLPVINCLAYL